MEYVIMYPIVKKDENNYIVEVKEIYILESLYDNINIFIYSYNLDS